MALPNSDKPSWSLDEKDRPQPANRTARRIKSREVSRKRGKLMALARARFQRMEREYEATRRRAARLSTARLAELAERRVAKDELVALEESLQSVFIVDDMPSGYIESIEGQFEGADLDELVKVVDDC